MPEKPKLFTSLSPALLHLYDLKDAVVVVIDVFRATSTIAAALYNGARYVIPVDAVSKAIEISQREGGIAAGERDGRLAEGLSYGNSPLEYKRDFINDKILVLTTTNGTRLLYMALANGAQEIITGSFPNLSSVCNYLMEQGKDVVLACAGWKDRFNMEDTLFAGAVIHKVRDRFSVHCDSSFMAEQIYTAHKDDLLTYAANLTHYHRLVKRFGYIDDIEYCLSQDLADVLPLYQEGRLIAG
ncbi:2-phosphosulfolactate phosphatase [Niabella terrae]